MEDELDEECQKTLPSWLWHDVQISSMSFSFGIPNNEKDNQSP